MICYDGKESPVSAPWLAPALEGVNSLLVQPQLSVSAGRHDWGSVQSLLTISFIPIAANLSRDKFAPTLAMLSSTDVMLEDFLCSDCSSSKMAMPLNTTRSRVTVTK